MSNSLLSKYYSFAKLSAAGTGAGTGRAARELLRTAQALEKELTCLKLDSLYRLCDKAVDNSTFVVLCTLPFVLQNAIGWKWYFTLPLGLFVNAYYFNRSEKSHETVAKQIVSDRQMFKLVSAEVPNWIGCDAEPCAWVNDMMSQSWSHMAQYGNLKVLSCRMLHLFNISALKKITLYDTRLGTRGFREHAGAAEGGRGEEGGHPEPDHRVRAAAHPLPPPLQTVQRQDQGDIQT